MSFVDHMTAFFRSFTAPPRRMVSISKRLRYDDAFLTPKIPEEFRILNRFDSDYPFFLAPNTLSPDVCDAMVAALRAQGSLGQLTVAKPVEGQNVSKVNIKSRNTELLVLPPDHLTAYARAFVGLRPHIEKFFGVQLTGSDSVQALGYPPGGQYRMHADNCSVVADDGKKSFHWVGSMSHRLISSILFLTDSVDKIRGENECTGGEVTFNYLMDEKNNPYRVRPQKGLFLAFPSNPYFTHQVHAVKKGYRVTLVDWYTGKLRSVAAF